jgi:hypothetical protein
MSNPLGGRLSLEDPLDDIDILEIQQHGDPSLWTPLGPKSGSGAPANSPAAPPGTLKIYEIYKDEFGTEIEVHYFRHPDGSVSGVKVVPRS